MVKRIILWKIKDDQNKQNNLNLLRKGLLELSTKINDIMSLEVGLNYSSSDFDIIFIVAFSDPFLLKQFQSHPEFMKVQQLAQSITTNMVFCDYMAESYGSASPAIPNASTAGNSAPMNNIPCLNNTPGLGNTPNINNLGMNSTPSINSIGMNNSQNNGGFMNKPAGNMNNMDNTKPFAPINSLKNNNQNNVPMAYGNKNTPAPTGFNQNQNQNQYNGFGNMSQSKQGVNFTTSEHINQFRFSDKDGNNMGNMNNSGSWKCSKCGKTNSSFINMCSCGKRKPSENMSALPNMPNPTPQNNQSGNSWVCPSCGKTNNDYMKICICGHRKVENNNNRGNNNISPFGNNMAPNASNKPMMPKNSNMNNIKSPNNNDFFNNFNGGGNAPRNNRMNNMGANNMGLNNMGGNNIGGNNMGGNNMGGNNMNGHSRMNTPPGFNNLPPNNRPLGINNMGGPNKNMPGNDGLPPDSWKCPRCGKVLGNFVGQCVCGQRKPSRPGGGQTGMRFG